MTSMANGITHSLLVIRSHVNSQTIFRCRQRLAIVTQHSASLGHLILGKEAPHQICTLRGVDPLLALRFAYVIDTIRVQVVVREALLQIGYFRVALRRGIAIEAKSLVERKKHRGRAVYA